MSKKRSQRDTKAFKTKVQRKRNAEAAKKREEAAKEREEEEKLDIAYNKYVEEHSEKLTPKDGPRGSQ